MKVLTGLRKLFHSELRQGEAGFTLVELLVVIGIIVALAAVVIPSVSGFADKGKTGAMAEELKSVQSAMDFMMVENRVIAVNTSPSTSKNDWATFPNGPGVLPLDGYLRASITDFYYCWDGSGKLTAQHPAPAACP